MKRGFEAVDRALRLAIYELPRAFRPLIGLDGRTYARYWRDSTATRVMALPNCCDLGG